MTGKDDSVGDGVRYRLNGKEVSREEFFASKKGMDGILRDKSVACFQSTGWPKKSWALGVHPSQIKEAMEECAKAGVPTNFAPDGDALLESRGHRKKYCETFGVSDFDAGHSDAAPKHAKGRKK